MEEGGKNSSVTIPAVGSGGGHLASWTEKMYLGSETARGVVLSTITLY